MAAFSDLSPEALENFSGCVAMLMIAVAFVGLRFYVRSSLRQRPLLTDWLCLASYVVFAAYSAVIFNHIFNVSKSGSFSGKAAGDLEEAKEFMKANPLGLVLAANTGQPQMGFAIELLFTLDITLVKLSILSFYSTLFAVDRTQRRVILAATCVCIAWWAVFTLLIVFQCRPIHYLWDRFGVADSCVSTPKLLLAVEVTNLLIEVAVLCIPVYALRHLRLDTNRKFFVCGIFLLGAAVCVTSIVRLTAIWNPPNIMLHFNFSKTALCSTLQLGMAIICGCVPTLGPLFTSTGTRARQIFDSMQNRRAAASSGYKMTDVPGGSDRPWADVGTSQFRSTTRSWAAREDDVPGGMHRLEPLPPTMIRVQRSIQVT